MIAPELSAPSNFKCGLLHGDLIEGFGKRFKVERWECNGFYTIDFVDVGEDAIPTFTRNPKYVRDLVYSNKLKVIDSPIIRVAFG
jgi:hypothetical protein